MRSHSCWILISFVDGASSAYRRSHVEFDYQRGRLPTDLGGLLFKKLRERSDLDLIGFCLKDHPPAWECLIHRYKKLVYHFPNQAKLRREDCDEVFQETFLALHKSLDKLLKVDDLASWIATVAQRHTWKVLHRNRRHPDIELPEPYEVPDPSHIPEKNLALKVQQSQIRQSLNLLNDKCRKLLTLLFYKYDSADYDRVSEELGIARGSIGPIRHRCLVKFRSILEKNGITQKNVSNWLD